MKLKHILLVDDSRATNFIHEIVIRETELVEVISIVENGLEALEYLQEESNIKPDLILLDINMPKMNGWEFLEKYEFLDRQLKAEVVLVMLTTSMNPGDRSKAGRFPEVTGFENKSLSKEKFEAIIEKYFPNQVSV